MQKTSHYLLGFYLLMTCLTVLIYGWDKFAARRQITRLSERSLHLFALFGGALGALIGQQLFNHKTRKWQLVCFAWLCLFLQLIAFLLINAARH